MDLLVSAMQSINKANDFQLISNYIFKFIDDFVSYNMIVIYKCNDKDNSLEVVSCVGSNVENLKKKIRFKTGEGVVGLVAQKKEAVIVNDALISSKIKIRQHCKEDPLIRSFMAIPLVVGNNVIGILSVSSSSPDMYTDYDMKMISIIASQGAAFLELNEYILEIENLSDQVLENVNSGVMVIDTSHRVLLFNYGAEKITGYSHKEIIGMELDKIPLKEKINHWYILETLNEHITFNEQKSYMIKKSGDIINISLSTSLIYDENNFVKKCICIFRDITELEELQRQVILAEKLSCIGRMTAGITHEIRNPLLPIRNASEYLLKKVSAGSKDSEVITLINIIIEESERLNRFLEQFSALSSNNGHHGGECEFNSVLQKTLILIRYNILDKKVKIITQLDEENIVLPYSEDTIRQILLNLLLNSLDSFNKNASTKDRRIDIKSNLLDEELLLTIEDNGDGIPESDLNKIFEPFYTTKCDGTGLGLPITLNIINGIGGRILIESELNKGTKVFIYIPIQERSDYDGKNLHIIS